MSHRPFHCHFDFVSHAVDWFLLQLLLHPCPSLAHVHVPWTNHQDYLDLDLLLLDYYDPDASVDPSFDHVFVSVFVSFSFVDSFHYDCRRTWNHHHHRCHCHRHHPNHVVLPWVPLLDHLIPSLVPIEHVAPRLIFSSWRMLLLVPVLDFADSLLRLYLYTVWNIILWARCMYIYKIRLDCQIIKLSIIGMNKTTSQWWMLYSYGGTVLLEVFEALSAIGSLLDSTTTRP